MNLTRKGLEHFSFHISLQLQCAGFQVLSSWFLKIIKASSLLRRQMVAVLALPV